MRVILSISSSTPGSIAIAAGGPDTYYMTNEQTFCCLSRAKPDIATELVNQMYGEYYYGLLLSIFFIKSCC
ncbi:hypothetical protein ACFTAO_50900 [Paenibacillus rhizoplanae]